eukprot:366334-Chlamydomonas_euryale.AAC.2
MQAHRHARGCMREQRAWQPDVTPEPLRHRQGFLFGIVRPMRPAHMLELSGLHVSMNTLIRCQ